MNHYNNNDHKEHIETLKALKSKLMTLSGYLITMRSDSIEEQKKISNHLKLLIKQVNIIKRNVGMYFIIITLLMIFIIQKILWIKTASNVFLS
jgi:hypothetical protein